MQHRHVVWNGVVIGDHGAERFMTQKYWVSPTSRIAVLFRNPDVGAPDSFE